VNSQPTVHCIVSQPFAENTYIAHLPGAHECIVVDPGLEPQLIFELLKRHKLTPVGILNTHGHADHIAGNAAMKAAFSAAPLIIGAGDAYKLTDPQANLSAGYGLPLVSPAADQLVRDREEIELAGLTLLVLETPGHSRGHVMFVLKQSTPWLVLGGDVLFQRGIGRTDFADGSFDELRASIHEKLFRLPDDTVVLPGHGPPTTIGEEKRENPWVGEPAGYRVER
jgi:glyoxylase-like metal-dependent hydrolase (beta-lactamase superfamily II)